MLATEQPDSIAVLTTGLARLVAETLNIRFTGTPVSCSMPKRAKPIDEIASLLDRLQELRFRVSPLRGS